MCASHVRRAAVCAAEAPTPRGNPKRERALFPTTRTCAFLKRCPWERRIFSRIHQSSSSSAGGRVDEKKKSVRRVAAGRLFFKKPFIISNLPDRETPSPLPRAPFPRPPSRLRPRSRAFFGPYPPREARRLRLFVARREGARRRAPRAPPAPSPRRPRTAVSPPPSSYRTRRPRLLVPRAPPRRVRRARTNDMCLSPPSRASASSRPPFLSRGWGTRRRRRSWR